MTREAQIPLFLWIATAVVVHALWGGGADRAAKVIEEKIEIREFAASVRRFVRGENRPIEIALLDDESDPKLAEPTAPPAPDQAEPDQADDKSATKDDAKPDPSQPPPPEPKKEPEKAKPPEQKKEEEKKKEDEKKPEVAAEPLPASPEEKRVAVRQHVEQNQADNPSAHFIADQANKVEEETRAKLTSNDQDDPKPTPGGAAQSSNDPNDPGDSDQTRILQSDDHRGERDRAPSEHPAPTELRIPEQPARAAPSTATARARAEGVKGGALKSASTAKLPAQEGQTPQPTLHAADEIPETLDSSHGAWEMAGEKSASIEQAGRQGRKRRELPPIAPGASRACSGSAPRARLPGGINLNLNPQVAVAAIG